MKIFVMIEDLKHDYGSYQEFSPHFPSLKLIRNSYALNIILINFVLGLKNGNNWFRNRF